MVFALRAHSTAMGDAGVAGVQHAPGLLPDGLRQPGAADGKITQLQRVVSALRVDDALVSRVAHHPNKLTAGRSAVFSVAPVALSTALGLGASGSML